MRNRAAPQIPAGGATARTQANTPSIAHLDVLGRSFLTIADNDSAGQYETRVAMDIEGNPLVITDAMNKQVMRHVFAMGGHKLYQESCDAGKRWMIADVAGKLLRAWDERGHTRRASYDALQRPTALFVEKDGVERMAERTIYGEGVANADVLNLRGKVYQHSDGAGVITNVAFDFKGNLLQSSRQLASEYKLAIDWSDGNAPSFENEIFVAQTSYDALNRPTSLTSPDLSEMKPTYNEAGLLEKVEARIRGAATWTSFVDDIDYDAKGQRERIVYGNGTTTTCAYDPLTFRLARLKTTRASDGAVLQNLTYTYDPVGNIVAIYDSAQQSVFFDNDVVTPNAEYEYDAIYRLVSASGREHAGGLADDIRGSDELPLNSLPHANDAQALRNYTQHFQYDAVGNILAMIHQVGGTPLWIRKYAYAAGSNRLLATRMPGDPLEGPYTGTYDHDDHGNMTRMPHLANIVWDENDQMHEVDLGGGGTAYYVYDAAGQRVRKVWEHSGFVEERIYLGAYEIYRKRDVTGLVLERETLHVMDDARRLAIIETKTVDTSVPAFQPVTRVRYQLGNHLGSACLEVDEAGLVISYEEYHPYGTAAYRSARSGVEVSLKRYRYTGKERDEETGLYYHGARYYAPWLGRWTAADPAGLVDGVNRYAYVRNNPTNLFDPTGFESQTIRRRRPNLYWETTAAAQQASGIDSIEALASQQATATDVATQLPVPTRQHAAHRPPVSPARPPEQPGMPTVRPYTGPPIDWSAVHEAEYRAKHPTARDLVMADVGNVMRAADPIGCGFVACGVYSVSRALGSSDKQARWDATYVDTATGIAAFKAFRGAGVVEPVADTAAADHPRGAGGRWPTTNEVVDPNVVRQEAVSSCSPACAVMATKSGTFKPTQNMFIQELGRDYIHGVGTKNPPLAESLNSLDPEAGKSYTWKAEIVFEDATAQIIEDLSAKGPWIASMRTITAKGEFGGHSVIVDGLSATGNVMIRDPAGKGTSYEMTIDDFNANWYGQAVVRR